MKNYQRKDQLQTKRIQAKLTQKYVAEYLGLKNVSTVSKWETGGSKPRAALLGRLARLYNCTIDELLLEADTS